MTEPDEFDRIIGAQRDSLDRSALGGLGSPDPDDDILAVLESADLIQTRDRDGLLWTLATAGSQVRRAVASSPSWLRALEGAERPRCLLLVTDSFLDGAADLVAELASLQAPAVIWRGAQLPRWAGPADALIAASVDGMHPRVAALVADADRRGLTALAVSPQDSPVDAAAGRAVRVSLDAVAPYRASVWAVAAPMLLAAHSLGVISEAPTQLDEAADVLDALAARCGPTAATSRNEAKQLAVEFAADDPVLLGYGPLPALAAQRSALALNTLAGAGAVALRLPEQTAAAVALLRSPGAAASSAADFFRDRVEVAGRSRRYLAFDAPLVQPGHRGGIEADSRDGAPDLVELTTARAAARVRDEAGRAGVHYSVVEPDPGGALAGYAQQWLLGEFVAAYLAIGRGLDLADPAPGA